MRTCGVPLIIWPVKCSIGINRGIAEKRSVFLHICITCSELPYNICTMVYIGFCRIYSNVVLFGSRHAWMNLGFLTLHHCLKYRIFILLLLQE